MEKRKGRSAQPLGITEKTYEDHSAAAAKLTTAKLQLPRRTEEEAPRGLGESTKHRGIKWLI